MFAVGKKLLLLVVSEKKVILHWWLLSAMALALVVIGRNLKILLVLVVTGCKNVLYMGADWIETSLHGWSFGMRIPPNLEVIRRINGPYINVYWYKCPLYWWSLGQIIPYRRDSKIKQTLQGTLMLKLFGHYRPLTMHPFHGPHLLFFSCCTTSENQKELFFLPAEPTGYLYGQYCHSYSSPGFWAN